ncbi:MAG: acetylxylan esterase, partial [Planctomycetales bacterium]|nr:acetylxylan esterase [Planctomycetales bacterium]
LGTGDLLAQPKGFNYDEAKVPKFDLPDPLQANDGSRVAKADQWPSRRAELLELFEQHVYGRSPGRPEKMSFRVVSTKDDALDGTAVRQEVDILLAGDPSGPQMRMLLYRPARAGKHPAFLGLNFSGNHTVQADPEISLPTSWVREGRGSKGNRATDEGRGSAATRWPMKAMIDRGYAVATIHYGDIDPDFDDGFKNGIHPLWWKAGDGRPRGDDGGSIAAWAWGLSRALDYLETDESIDAKRVAVLGHSRLGKTSLWAGATDTRFAIVISNNSGCGGAAISRRRFGETVQRINTSFPHWFCDNFNQYNDNENALPIDQHELLALAAPRAVYVASATEDQWADPRGEFLSLAAAVPVYRLLGKSGFADGQEMPGPMQPVIGDGVGYHLREGKHDLTEYDWQRYMDFADRVYGRK